MPCKVAVVVPVGPRDYHATWLSDCLDSIAAQASKPDLIVVVDDMHGIGELPRIDVGAHPVDVLLYQPPWLLGVAGAFNHGCAVAFAQDADVAIMLGADDRLGAGVVASLRAAWEADKDPARYYWFDTHYQDGNQQRLPCNNAAVTSAFMQATGGLPIEASAGAMDAALISALLTHRPAMLRHVTGPDAYFWSRQHPQQETARLNAYAAANGIIRDVFTNTFTAPQWGRYS